MTQHGHLSYLLTGKIYAPDHLRDPDHGVCPPGSDCAKAAVERVRRIMNTPTRIGINLSRSRFVEKTGYDE